MLVQADSDSGNVTEEEFTGWNLDLGKFLVIVFFNHVNSNSYPILPYHTVVCPLKLIMLINSQKCSKPESTGVNCKGGEKCSLQF